MFGIQIEIDAFFIQISHEEKCRIMTKHKKINENIMHNRFDLIMGKHSINNFIRKMKWVFNVHFKIRYKIEYSKNSHEKLLH